MSKLVEGENIAIGYRTLSHSINANNNIAIGNDALISNISGKGNVGIGLGSLAANTNNNDNIGIGYLAGNMMEGGDNVVMGSDAGMQMKGSENVAIGRSAGMRMSGNWNTIIGTGAGQRLNGDRNIIIVATFDGNANKSNQLNIGGWIYGDNGLIGIGTVSPAYKLDIAGKARLIDTLFGTKAKFISLAIGDATENVVTVDEAGNIHRRSAQSVTGNSVWNKASNDAVTAGVQYNGNVGIGTANPMYKLDVVGKAKLTDTLFGTRAKLVNLERAAVTDSVVMIDNAGNLHKRNASAFTGSNIWSIAANNAKAKGAQFDGNIGIGTANPMYKLDVVGKAKLTDTLFGTKAKFSGLAAGGAADNLVTVDNLGNLHKLSAPSLSSWSVNSSQQLYTNLPLAIGTGKNGSHANATQPGTILTINGRTHIGKADGSDLSWVNYDQSASVKDYLLYVQKGLITEDMGIATAGNSDWNWSDFVLMRIISCVH